MLLIRPGGGGLLAIKSYFRTVSCLNVPEVLIPESFSAFRNALMFNNELMADVHFIVGPPGGSQKVPAHKVRTDPLVQGGTWSSEAFWLY